VAGPASRWAFTLAEVLITLGIIGVVAALTIPSFVAKYQMKTFETAFKKQYSVIQNTIDYLGLENSISECYMGIDFNEEGTPYYVSRWSDCATLKQGLISKLNLSEIKNGFYNYYAKKRSKTNMPQL